jgi:hypothetical protein
MDRSLFFFIFDLLFRSSGDLVAVEGVQFEMFDASVFALISDFWIYSSSK